MQTTDDKTVLDIVGDLLGRELARRDLRLRALESRPPAEKGDKGERGEKGESIKGDPGESVKGDKGERGESIKGDPGESIKGDPGKGGTDGTNGLDGAGITSPAWTTGIHRAGVLVQHHIGQHYRASVDTAAEPPHADWERIGSGGFRLAGAYAEGREFLDGDLFVREFSLFHWHAGEAHLWAARGSKGERGERGLKGEATHGNDGRDGSTIEAFELRDARMVLVVRSDGELHDMSVELLPHFEALAFAMQERIDQVEARTVERFESALVELRKQLQPTRKAKP